QGVLIGRVVLYWISGLLYLGVGCALSLYFQHPERALSEHFIEFIDVSWPWVPTAVCVLPLVMFDIVRLSNLFVGPVYRLRMHLSRLIQDPEVRPLSFRTDDYWTELSEPINVLQTQLLELRDETEILKRKNRLLSARSPFHAGAPEIQDPLQSPTQSERGAASASSATEPARAASSNAES
ncbi:MAG: hypothetical protein KDA51_00065, partial [Planctomycetales bacterium]|nr:hypothetical protein [Planctomycetales bacterium]